MAYKSFICYVVKHQSFPLWILTSTWFIFSAHFSRVKRKRGKKKGLLTSIPVQVFQLNFIVALSFFYQHPYFLKNKKFLKILFIFRGEGRKRGRETSLCGCLFTRSYWGPGLQPRLMCWLGINWQPFGLQASTQSTEPHHNIFILTILNFRGNDVRTIRNEY